MGKSWKRMQHRARMQSSMESLVAEVEPVVLETAKPAEHIVESVVEPELAEAKPELEEAAPLPSVSAEEKKIPARKSRTKRKTVSKKG